MPLKQIVQEKFRKVFGPDKEKNIVAVNKKQQVPIKKSKEEVKSPVILAKQEEIQVKKKEKPDTRKKVEAVVKAAAFTLGGVAGLAGIFWLIYLFFWSVRIYHIDEENKRRYAGSCMIVKSQEGFLVYIPNILLEQSYTGQYNLCIGYFFSKKNKGKELIVSAGDKKEAVWIDREIPFRLPAYV